jgi:hypothetical protein
MVLQVQGNVDSEMRSIDNNKPTGALNQQWDVVYADEWKGEPKKGEYNEDFGFYVERPFYIVTQLPSRRYLSVINNRQITIKTPHGQNTQTWWFDQRTLTVKTKLNNQSFDIASSGRSKNFQIWSTNSNWW